MVTFDYNMSQIIHTKFASRFLTSFWVKFLQFSLTFPGQLSEPFQKLLEQLVDQHLAELAERDPKLPSEAQKQRLNASKIYKKIL